MIVAFAAVNATPFKRCSEQRFRTAITGAGGKTMPPVAVPCQKAVYAALCHECGDDIGCFWSKGPKIAPTLSECQHHKTGRNLRSLVGSSTRCNEKSFQEAIAKVPTTGVALGCQRAVYNALCDTCGSSMKCYMEKGPSIAKSTPLCRPREVTTYDMEDEEEQVGGRWGRVCATAACLFIDGLNPPREPYRPGASNGNAPIHRPYGADMMEDGDENVGHYKLPHDNHDPRGWPGHDIMEDGDEQVGNRWGRVCATAACLVIDGLNPPREPYRPGATNGNPPIHRPFRGADVMEDGDESVGNRWGRVCATAACLFIDGLNPPREPYRPGASNGNAPIHRPYGADMMEDGDVNNVGGYMHNGKYYYDGQAANSNYHPGGGFHHNGNSYPSGTYMDEDDESVGFGDERPSHTRAHRPTSKSVGDWINFRL